ncbi:MAG: hypothetical protein EA369_03605 [Bradymonadales bacterium]|nr:MAG: hypothetical protein EA369_03605 [Bradymonadales bacterium]
MNSSRRNRRLPLLLGLALGLSFPSVEACPDEISGLTGPVNRRTPNTIEFEINRIRSALEGALETFEARHSEITKVGFSYEDFPYIQVLFNHLHYLLQLTESSQILRAQVPHPQRRPKKDEVLSFSAQQKADLKTLETEISKALKEILDLIKAKSIGLTERENEFRFEQEPSDDTKAERPRVLAILNVEKDRRAGVRAQAIELLRALEESKSRSWIDPLRNFGRPDARSKDKDSYLLTSFIEAYQLMTILCLQVLEDTEAYRSEGEILPETPDLESLMNDRHPGALRSQPTE